MITETFAKKQLERLSGLDQFPKQAAAVRELLFALMVSETDAIAIGTIDYTLAHTTSSNPRCPLPADLRRICYEANEIWEREKPVKPSPPMRAHCALCGDTGVRESNPGFRVDDFTSVASWCVCERGREHPRPDYRGHYQKAGEDWVDTVNRARASLGGLSMRQPLFGKKIGALAKLAHLDNPLDYNGEF